MNFDWTSEQHELYDQALKFATQQLNQPVEDRETAPHFTAEAWRLCGAFGLLGLCVPACYGGMGLGALSTARVFEAVGKGCQDGGLLFSAAAHLFACAMPLLEHGSDVLKQQILPQLCSGAWIGANAMTEAEAGSDVSRMATTAVREHDDYILNGVKSYVTNGPVAHLFVVYATTDAAAGYMGLTAFVVERDRPGVQVGRPFATMGLTTSPISTLYLEDCRIPVTHCLGREGQGAAIFAASMQWERACLFAIYLGLMARQVEQCLAHAKGRKQSGRPIGKFQAISHRIADMYARLEAARFLLYRACWMIDQRQESTLEVALSKLAVSEAAIQSGLDAIHIHGGMGIVPEIGIEQGLRDAIPAALFSGTSDIQRNIIAGRLGL